mgnify:FL=1
MEVNMYEDCRHDGVKIPAILEQVLACCWPGLNSSEVERCAQAAYEAARAAAGIRYVSGLPATPAKPTAPTADEAHAEGGAA